jgi:hypothetical protein
MNVLARTSSNLPDPITIDAFLPQKKYPTYHISLCVTFPSPLPWRIVSRDHVLNRGRDYEGHDAHSEHPAGDLLLEEL